MSVGTVCETGNKLACVGTKLGRAAHKGLFTLKKFSPELLAIGGSIGFVATIVMASKATLKAPAILEEHRAMIDAINEAKSLNSESYQESAVQQDLVLTYLNTGKEFLALYGPSIAVGILSLGGLLGSSFILKKRNIAIAGAYSLIEKAFNEYRGRVTKELGAEKDFHFRYGTEYETVTEEVKTKDGKKKVKKQVQKLGPNELSMYARKFEEQQYNHDGTYTGSSEWSSAADYNATNLILKNGWANERLKAQGYLFLNDVYEELGFPRTKAGQIVGWLFDGSGDDYVSFGPEVDALINKQYGYLQYQDGRAILLDFNVDGNIIDAIE